MFARSRSTGCGLHSATQDAIYTDSHWKRGYFRLGAAINERLAAVPPPSAVAVPEFAHGELELGKVVGAQLLL